MNPFTVLQSLQRLARSWPQGLVLACLLAVLPAQAVRIKEVATVQGVRSNQLTGFGLVVGLDGTGDQTTQMPYTAQGLSNYLQQLGISLPAGAATQLQLKNIAAVMVTAQLPAFAQPGQWVDVNVSSMGNAKSLKGGMLLMTPLKGVDGEIYALAQGNLVVAGAGAAAGGSKVQINHLSAGRIPAGATVERSVPSPFHAGAPLQLDLASSDFATARAVAGAINESKGAGTAQAVDGRVVKVKLPPDEAERVGFIADIENLPVTLAKPAARIVLCTNGSAERDGTRHRYGITVRKRFNDPVAAMADTYGVATEVYRQLETRR